MKLPITLVCALTSAAVAQEAPASPQQEPAAVTPSVKLKHVKLPVFHESWTESERAVISDFAAKLDKAMSTEEIAQLKDFMPAAAYLSKVVESGKLEKSFDNGDTLCRLAAMFDHFEAMRLFVERGEDVNSTLTVHHFQSGIGLEVLMCIDGFDPSHTALQRVEQLVWLTEKGWDPQKQLDTLRTAISFVAILEPHNVAPLVQWYIEQVRVPQEEIAHLIHGEGCTDMVKQWIENDIIAVNEPLEDMLPLQCLCQFVSFSGRINLHTLELLLNSGADPNLIVAYEDTEEDSAEYDNDAYESEDGSVPEAASFSTAAEMVVDSYLNNLPKNNRRRAAKFCLAALDLLLIHGAELDNLDDDEEVMVDAREITKRLSMSKEELQADYEKLRAELYQ